MWRPQPAAPEPGYWFGAPPYHPGDRGSRFGSWRKSTFQKQRESPLPRKDRHRRLPPNKLPVPEKRWRSWECFPGREPVEHDERLRNGRRQHPLKLEGGRSRITGHALRVLPTRTDFCFALFYCGSKLIFPTLSPTNPHHTGEQSSDWPKKINRFILQGVLLQYLRFHEPDDRMEWVVYVYKYN